MGPLLRRARGTGERVEEVADRIRMEVGAAEVVIAVDRVRDSCAVVVVMVARDVPGVYELVNDALGAAFANADDFGELPEADVGLLGDADERMPMV